MNTVNRPAVCDGSLNARKEHARALSESPHDPSVVTGANLLMVLEAGCKG